ncbi:MAG: hypothetical protein WC861_05680 [Candidatus Micrarchaeia archaeon]|jgi:hypothetical protein
MIETITGFAKGDIVRECNEASMIIRADPGSHTIGAIWSNGSVRLESAPGVPLTVSSLDRLGLRAGDLEVCCGLMVPFNKVSSNSMIARAGSSIKAKEIRVYGDLVLEGADVEAENILVLGDLIAVGRNAITVHHRMVCGGDNSMVDNDSGIKGNAFFSMKALAGKIPTFEEIKGSSSRVTDDVVKLFYTATGHNLNPEQKSVLGSIGADGKSGMIYLCGRYYRIARAKKDQKFRTVEQSREEKDMLVAHREYLRLAGKIQARTTKAQSVRKLSAI